MSTLFALPRTFAVQLSGIPYAGAKLYFYQAGTLNDATVYQDINQTTPHAQPVSANDQGIFPAIYLNSSSTTNYRVKLKTSAGTQVWDQDDVPALPVSGAEFQTLFDANVALYPRTAAEIAASIIPISTDYPEGDARRHGWSSAASSAVNAAAIQTTALAFTHSNTLAAGTIQLPVGDFNCDPITIAQSIRLRGAGRRATTITYTGAAYFATFGGQDSNRTDGSGMEDLTVLLTNKDGKVGKVLCGCYGTYRNLYLEGPTVASRTNVGFTIDGGSTGAGSAFGNLFENINFSHMQNGIQVLTTGTQRPTQQHILNCYFNGDILTVGAGSVGLSVASTCGDGVIVDGGNFESLGTGIALAAGALTINVRGGTRFEANTKDVTIGTGAHPSFFRGLVTDTVYNVTDTDGLASFEDCVALLSPSTYTQWRRGRIGGSTGPRWIYRTDVTFAASATGTGAIPAGIASDNSFDVFVIQDGGTLISYGQNKGSHTSTTFSLSASTSNSNTVSCLVVG